MISRGSKRAVVFLVLIFSCSLGFAGIYDDLMQAIDNGDTNTVTTILQRGMDVNTVDKSGNSLLMLAVQKENIDLVRFLVEHRARQVKNQYGDTPLMVAALKGNLDMVKLLVNAGADVNNSGWTPLIYAAFEGKDLVVRYLLEKGADVDAVAPNQMTALMLAAKNGHEDTVRALIVALADLEHQTSDGETALSLARAGKRITIIKLLEEAGATH